MTNIGFKIWLRLCAALACSALFASHIAAADEILAWDSTSKQVNAKAGDTNAIMTFSVTNVSPAEVVINAVRTSCGCTTAKMPILPWKLAPGESGQFDVTMDLRGKRGTITKTVTVDTSSGTRFLTVSTVIPELSGREKNQMLALTDRQAIFKNDCASCHVTPAVGKKGQELYATACGICHEAEHRASMVPDLKALGKKTDAEYWTTWIYMGKPGTLMPAFARTQGGPLDGEQIQSLVEYLSNHFPPKTDKANASVSTSGNAAAAH